MLVLLPLRFSNLLESILLSIPAVRLVADDLQTNG